MAWSKKQKLIYHYYVLRSRIWRRQRLMFTSPAEIRFIRIMGGKVVTLEWIRSPYNNDFPLAIVLSLGKIMKREKVKREVRVGKYFIDFGNDIKRGIEIDGRDWHQDVLKEQERDEYVAQFGWNLLHIQATEVYRSPDFVQRKVLAFLTK